MNKLCPGCREPLLRLPCKMDNGQTKEVFIHPINPLKTCQYKEDGITMEVSIYDNFLFSKFQELMEKESFEEQPSTIAVIDKGTERSEVKAEPLFTNCNTTELYKLAWIYRNQSIIKAMVEQELKNRGDY